MNNSKVASKGLARQVIAISLVWGLGVAVAFSVAYASDPETASGSHSEPKGVLKFITIDVPPWAAVDPDTGEQEGAFIALVEALEELTGYTIKTTLTPFARVDRELESGDHDCTILVPRDTDIVIHGEVIANHDVGILSNKSAPITRYEELHGKTISLLRGSAISPRFDADEDINKVYDTDYQIALRKLDRQRVAGIAGAIPTLRYLAAENGLTDILAPPLKLTDIPLVFQCSRQSEYVEIMPEFNAAIRALRESGRLDEITDLYHF